MLGGRDGPKRGRLAGREAAPKFFARPLERSAGFDAILGKSSPKSNRLTLGRGWSARPILSLVMAKRIFFLRKAENWKFAEPNKHSDCSRIDFISSLDTSWSEHKASCRQQRGPVMFSMDLSAQRPVPCHALVYTFETLMGRFDSKQSCPKSVRTDSQQMELNINYQVCRLLDRPITSDGSVFRKKRQNPPLTPMRDVENLDHINNRHLQTHLARLAASRLHLGVY